MNFVIDKDTNEVMLKIILIIQISINNPTITAIVPKMKSIISIIIFKF